MSASRRQSWTSTAVAIIACVIVGLGIGDVFYTVGGGGKKTSSSSSSSTTSSTTSSSSSRNTVSTVGHSLSSSFATSKMVAIAASAAASSSSSYFSDTSHESSSSSSSLLLPYTCSGLRKRGRGEFPVSRMVSHLRQLARERAHPQRQGREDEEEGGYIPSVVRVTNIMPTSNDGKESRSKDVSSSSPSFFDFIPSHTYVNSTCPIFVMPSQDQSASLGRRLLTYSMAISVAVQFGVTFVHTPLGEEAINHETIIQNEDKKKGNEAEGGGGSIDWDALLGLGIGEWTEVDVLNTFPTISRKDLPSWNGATYNEKTFERSQWVDTFRPHGGKGQPPCHSFFTVSSSGWAHDPSYHSKAIMAAKFALQLQRLSRDGANGGGSVNNNKSPLPPPLWSPTSDVSIVAMVRRGRIFDSRRTNSPSQTAAEVAKLDTGIWDWHNKVKDVVVGGGDGSSSSSYVEWYPTDESVQARIIGETIIPQLREASVSGGRIVITVVSDYRVKGGGVGSSSNSGTNSVDSEDASVAFPFLSSLAQQFPDVKIQFHTGSGGTQAWSALYYASQADFLVSSESLFSYWAGHLSSKPLVLSQPDSDRWRHCSEGAACCGRDGACTFMAIVRTRETSRRLAAAQTCRALAKEKIRNGRRSGIK